jgi:hypothetical protein
LVKSETLVSQLGIDGEQMDLGVQFDRPGIKVHGTEENPLAVDDERLGVQAG